MIETMRDRFTRVAAELLDEDPMTALVLADIGVGTFAAAAARHPNRVINVGIREQAQVGVAAGLSIEGFRPIVHTYAPFLVERPYEFLKLDLVHQDLGAVLVSVGASFDSSLSGRTHHAPGDVAAISMLSGWQIYVPGHPDEVEVALRRAMAFDDRVYIRLSANSNRLPLPVRPFRASLMRTGSQCAPVVVAVGPMFDAVADATADLDVHLMYAATVRPLDTAAIARVMTAPEVVIVEPYLEGTSAHELTSALSNRPHRVLSIGVSPGEHRRYGSVEDHNAGRGLDAATIRRRIGAFRQDRRSAA